MSASYHVTHKGIKLAYVHTQPSEKGGALPAVVFLGGFKSDMEGTKAIFLQEECKKRGQEFLRFDYSGHGQSDGAFVDGTIGIWKNDAIAVIDHVLQGRDMILVGSSMGGWISLRILMERPERIKGVIGIAPAPDFTKDIEAQLTDENREEIAATGRLEVPNDYSDDPYIFTKALIDDGREQSLLHLSAEINVPLTLIQGKCDTDVPWEKANKIDAVFDGPQNKVIFIDDGDHRLSRDQDLRIIDAEVRAISGI